jgi:hypothetical protein
MRSARFVWSGHGLLLESPVPLTEYQQRRAAAFALPVFKQRHASVAPGDRRDAIARVIKALMAGDWTLRPVPRADSDTEVIVI